MFHRCLNGQIFCQTLCNGENALVAFQQDASLGPTVSACYGMEAGFWLFLNTNHQMFWLLHYGLAFIINYCG